MDTIKKRKGVFGITYTAQSAALGLRTIFLSPQHSK
jgi:hypothetical protein